MIAICKPTFGEDFKGDDDFDATQRSATADPVSELRNQDSAFSLLIEAFRQVQSYLIQSDYEARLQAAQSLTDIKTRRQVTVLAKQERDLRLKKLYGQVDNLSSTYEHAREHDEQEAGVVVPNDMDRAAAARELQDYVFIVPAESETSEKITTRTVAASTYLRDIPRPR